MSPKQLHLITLKVDIDVELKYLKSKLKSRHDEFNKFCIRKSIHKIRTKTLKYFKLTKEVSQ